MARGHCGSPLFATDEDREFVLARAARAFRESGATCLGWSILVNHYHVLVRCEGPPGETFSRLNSAIAWRESRRRGEHGSVFQDRFHSDTCDDEESFLSRFGYVLGNPIHHRVVPTVDALRSYQWSGLGEILGLREAKWIDPAAALAAVHPDPERARETILDVLERKTREWAGDESDPDADRFEASAPAPSMLQTAPRDVAPPPLADRPIDVLRNALRREGWTPDRLVPAACALTGALPDAVRSGARTRPEAAARSLIAFVACDVAGWSMVETARAVGVGPTALGRARLLGRSRIAELRVSPDRLLQTSRERVVV